MTGCTDIRLVLDQWVEGALDDSSAREVARHVEQCAACRDEAETLHLILATATDARQLEPPASLGATIAASPCQRWQTMLFRAVDNQLPEDSLERVIEHLDECPDCRRVWTDLTLVRQVSEALTPPPELAARCASVRRRSHRPPLGLRTAAAAALVLAVLTSFFLSNAISNGNNGGSQLHTVVGEGVTQVADTNTSELRLMVWSAWQWTERQLSAIGTFLTGSGDEEDQASPAPTPTPTTDTTQHPDSEVP